MSEYAWIEWSGGECPVHLSMLVDVKLRDGTIMDGECAGDFVGPEPRTSANTNWLHDGSGLDIIAYRLSGPSA
jgi:hypothetical protein